jgi:hypothetical protein
LAKRTESPEPYDVWIGPAGGAVTERQVEPASDVRASERHDPPEHGIVPNTHPSLEVTKVAECGWNAAGTGTGGSVVPWGIVDGGEVTATAGAGTVVGPGGTVAFTPTVDEVRPVPMMLT